MARSNKRAVTVNKGQNSAGNDLIVNQLIIRPVDRTPKDISDWRAAHRAAEATAMPLRTRLLDLYSEAMLDPHLTGIVEKRVLSVVNKPLVFIKNNGQVADEYAGLFKTRAFKKTLKEILYSKFYGLSCLEFPPGKSYRVKSIPRKHVKPWLGRITWEQSGEDGVDYQGNPFLWVIDTEELGLLLKAVPYCLYKRGDIGDWAQFVEIFGQPTRVAKYDSYDLKTKLELKEALDEAGSSLALLIPKQADFEMKDGKQSNADGQLQQRLMEACDQQLSILVLGVTETTKSSSSSGYAQSETHAAEQKEIRKADQDELLSYLNSDEYLAILKSHGYPVDGEFVFSDDIDLDSLKKRLEIDLQINRKVPMSKSYWYDKYNVPVPAKGDPTTGGNDGDTAPAGTGENRQENGDVGELADTRKLSFFNRVRLAVADFFDPAL